LIRSLASLATEDAAKIGDRLHEELLRHLSAFWRTGATVQEMVRQAESIALQFIDPLARHTANVFFGSYLGGAGEVIGLAPSHSFSGSALADRAAEVQLPTSQGGLAEPITSPALHQEIEEARGYNPIIDRAVARMAAKQPMLKADFQSASDAVRVQAFTMAGVHTTGTVAKVQDSLIQSMESGDGFRGFRNRLRGELDTSPTGIGALRNAYRTGIARMWTEGQDEVLKAPLVGFSFPYVENVPIWDSNLTEFCQKVTENGLHGTAIFRRDDPFWIRYKPPRHHQCRCHPRPLTIEQAAKKGVNEAKIWLASGRPPTIPTFVPYLQLAFPKGWIPI